MAHFIGRLKGARGAVSRLGHKSTGVTVSAQGWEIGARVEVDYDERTESDGVEVWITRGSHGAGQDIFLGRFWLDAAGNILRYSPNADAPERLTVKGVPV